jgi:hypothetical protein
MLDRQTDPELPQKARSDNELPEETKNHNDDDPAVIDALESPLGQVLYASDPPPTSSAPPPPLPAPKKRFHRGR